MRYVVLKQGLNGKPILLPEDKIYETVTTDKDWYQSLYFYNEEHKKQFDKIGSVKGIKDTETNKIFFDLDSKASVDESRKSALQVIDRLKKQYNINPNDLEIYFSGNKGLNLTMTVDKFVTPKQLGEIASRIAGDLPGFDLSMYDSNQIIRVPFTKHHKSGKYKIPLSPTELKDLSIDVILNKATNLPEDPSINVKEHTLPDEFYKVERRVEKVNNISMDHREALARKPKQWKDAKWLIAEGFFEGGQRNQAMMVLAATYKAMGYNKENTYGLCKAAARQQGERAGTPPFPKEEIWNNVLSVIYDDGWEGGQYSVDNDPWLKDYAIKMGVYENDSKEDHPRQIKDIDSEFTDFVLNIEDNTVLTGIKWLDDEMPLTIGNNLAILGAPSSGKCLGKDTPIRMFDGSIKMVQDVKIGDFLMGDDSTARKVLSTCKGREKLYKVKQDNGNDYVVNASHILSLKTSENKGTSQKGDIWDVNVEEYINLPKDNRRLWKGYKVAVEYPEKELSIDPYYMGLWLGDGNSWHPHIYNVDQEIIDFVEKYANELEQKFVKYVDPRTNVCTLKINGLSSKKGSNYLLNEMRELEVIKNKHIPRVYMVNSRENRLKLLAGLIDSDGHSTNGGTSFSITQKNEKLANDIVELCRSLGYKTSISSVSKAATNGSNIKADYFTVYFSANDYSDLPLKLSRKTPNSGTSKSQDMTKLDFEDLGEGDYYGFEIDGNHRFLLGDFTVTHNTALALEILKNTSQAGVITVFASLDMARKRLYQKLLHKVSGGMNRDEIFDLYRQGKGHTLRDKIAEDYGNVWFYDRSSPSVSDVREYILNIERKTGKKVKLLMIDYFERLNSDKAEETAASKQVAGQLQDLLNDLDLCIVTLVQPNKNAIPSPDTPLLSYSSIKGSSYLAQAFRSVVAIWRPFFSPESTNIDKYLEMAILKNDLGELGKHVFSWEGRTGNIAEPTTDEMTKYGFYMEEKKNAKAEAKGGSDGWS